MLKKFRSLFSQRNPVEFEVHRRPPADSELAPHALPASSEAPDEESTRARTLEALEQVRIDIERQRDTHERIASSLANVEGRLEPMGQRLGQQMEAIAGSGRHIAELVAAFHSAEQVREDSFQVSMKTMTVTAQQQLQVLTVLQQQIDHSQESMARLAERFDTVGGGLESLLQAQRTSVERTEDLVEAVRSQVEATTSAHRQLFGATIAVLALGGIALAVGVVLVIVYAT